MDKLFGTDGIRAKVGSKPLTLEFLPKIGQAIAQWAINKKANPKFLIAQDTRLSCNWVKACLKSGLLLDNIELYDTGILPTPAIYHILKNNNNYNFGIIISASHNPACDNGIKLIDAKSGKISIEDEQTISQIYNSLNNLDIKYSSFGSEHIFENAEKIYENYITKLFSPYFLNGQKIVLDCANGATYKVAPEIFKALGANIIAINNEPNGLNINLNCGALYLESLQKRVLQENAVAGFAFDGDGDRVIAVNKFGQVKDGDDILAILATHSNYLKNKSIVATVMSNQGLEEYFKLNNKSLIRTDVGDKYVTESLLINNLTLGGEQSGHIILRDIINTGDGILVALKILETLLLTNNLDMQSFNKFPQVLLNVPIKIKKDLNSSPIKEIVDDYNKSLSSGRILVRYSGTEPLLRIMVETEDDKISSKVAGDLSKEISTLLN